MQIRIQGSEVRHHTEGLRGLSEYTTLTFTEETLLIVEVKATLGKSATPGFYVKTQGKGGEYNTERVAKLARGGEPYWKREQVLEIDLSAMDKVTIIENAQESGNIHYIHAQVFLDSEGKINTLAGKGVGQGSGIQFNGWPENVKWKPKEPSPDWIKRCPKSRLGPKRHVAAS